MGLLSRVWNRLGRMSSTLVNPERWFFNWATGNSGSEPGPAVNEFTALNYLAVYQCVSLIVGKIAELPLVTYREEADGDRVPAKDRPEYRLLLEEFNSSMSAFTAREAGLGHLLTWGNSYTQIVKNKSGSQVRELIPIGPDCVKVRRVAAGLVYDVFARETREQLASLDSREVLHVPGFGFDGLIGYSPIRVAKTAIRAGMTQDREAEKYITRGIRPPGAVKFKPGAKFRDAEDARQWREKFERIHAAEDSARNVVILEDGAEWQDIGVDPKSAQLLESRKYSRKEICGIYRVPPFLIGDIESSTSWGTGVAQQMQNFVDYCLLTWMRRVEVEYKRKLAPGDDSIVYRHAVEEMLRGDFVNRTAALNTLHQRGIITDNEWRRIEYMNRAEGGDVRHVPLNETLIDENGDAVILGDPAAAPAQAPPPPNEQAAPDTPPEPPADPAEDPQED